MEQSLLVIERIALEALEGRTLNLDDLKSHTGLSHSILTAVLHNLIERGIVTKRRDYFEINWELKAQWLPLVTDKEGVKAEILELFSSLLNEIQRKSGSAHLRIQKIWLDKNEIDKLKIKFQEIEDFIKNVKERRKKKQIKEMTCDRQVLFYGSGCYDDLVKNILKAS